MTRTLPFPFASCGIALLLAMPWGGVISVGAEEGGAKPFPPTSAEHQALTASSPYLGNDAFTLRNDYWKGTVSTDSGTAVRLQFFKGNTYRLIFGVSTDHLPKTARLHLHIFDSKEKEVSTVAGEPGQAAIVLNFEKNRKTDLYLVLMRIEPQVGPTAPVEVPSVLFYGWE
ncbi:MAG: hypothetical protein KDN20_26490 [Verrucomicrobiae bacterium]|nr:hypothetical protein [Verrucomicrobiae bacterium]